MVKVQNEEEEEEEVEEERHRERMGERIDDLPCYRHFGQVK